MAGEINDILGKAVQSWKTAQSARPHDPVALAEVVDTFASDGLEALRARLVATLGPESDRALTQAIAQSAVADHKRRDFTRMLPPELVMTILSHCGWNDLANAGRVNRALFDASQKLLRAQPMGTIRLSLLPHRRQKIPTYKALGFLGVPYGSELVQPVHSRTRWSVVHPHGVELLHREGDEFVAATSYPTVRRMEAAPKWMYGYSHAWHPDGTHFATMGWVDNALRVHIVAVHDDGLQAVCYLPLTAAEENAQLCWCTSHSNLLAVSSDTRTQIFDLTNVNEPVCTLPAQMRVPELYPPRPPSAYCPQFPMSWSPTAPVLCTGDAQGNLAMWDLTDVDNPAAVPLPALPVDEHAVATWHPQGKMLCYATRDTVAIVQPGNTKPLYSMASKALLVKFPCSFMQTQTTTDQIHAAWEPGGHPYLAIVRAGNALIAHWDGQTLTPVRWEIGGLGLGRRLRWVDGDALEMLDSGSETGVWRVTA